MYPTFRYAATVVSIYDADTITVAIDLGFRMSYTTSVRFFGIDAPELKTAEGKLARDFLKTIIAPGDKVIVETFKNPEDKYGRWLANVYIDSGLCLNQVLVINKHAKEYFGGKKEQ